MDEQRPDENNNLLVGLGYECGESKENTSQPTNQANAWNVNGGGVADVLIHLTCCTWKAITKM